MFEGLDRFPKILVTGPQRAGTTICARMIAHDTGHCFVPEEEIGVDSLNRLWDLWRTQSHFVMQCPALMRYTHHFGDDETLIVVMRRDVADIVASQERIGWEYEPAERIRYQGIDSPRLPDRPIAEIKYNDWLAQAHRIAHKLVIRYEDLALHELWVPAERRQGWGPRQMEEIPL